MKDKRTMETQIKDYAKMCDKIQTLSLELHGTYNLEKSMNWMTEEFGEVIAAIIKKRSKEDIAEEFGDLITWIFVISNNLNIKVSDSIIASFKKEVNRQINKYGDLKINKKDV